MTNASVKNPYLVLFLAGVLVLSLGVFAKAVHAQDYDAGSYDDGGDSYDTGSYDDSYDDSYDAGSYDTSYDPSAYDDSYDAGSYDTGYDDSYDAGSYDDSYDSGCDSSCYSDTGYDYNYDTDCGCEEYDTTPEYTEESYSTPEYSEETTPEEFSAPSYSSPSYSAPSYSSYSAPIIPSAPIVQNVPIAYQQQQQQQQQQQAAPTTITNNTCTGNSCNTTTTISNSGNTTNTLTNVGNTVTTITPIAAAPVTYPVQYTFPQPTYNYQNVSCTITASPNSVQSGQYAYLSWQSSGAISATLTNYGNVAPNGSLSVQPSGSVNYVLTVYGQNGQSSTCNTFVSTQNITPSVTLSQIPYTGFDFGTLGDSIYFGMLALFALAAGYLLVYYKGGVGAFALAAMPARKSQSSVKTTKVEKKVAPVAERRVETPAPAPVKAAALATLPAFASSRPTSDSMTIASQDGAPRIVISRN